jgi:ABC-type lipoprotein release transport system permease subunit
MGADRIESGGRGAPHGPGVLGAIAGLLAVAATTASFIPARRATTVDPLMVLKAE